MPKFLQIGDQAINLDLVITVTFDRSEPDKGLVVLVDMVNGDPTEPYQVALEGEDAQRFEDWWYTKAPVYKIG